MPQYLRHASVRSRLLAEPDLECYTIRLPARAFRSGTGGRSGALSTLCGRHPPQRRAFRAPPRERARQLRETRERRCHGQNPLSVGPCFTRALSQAATPLLDPHYRASSLVWMAPTSTHHRPCPRFLDLFTGAHILRTDTWISLVTTCSQCQARYGLGPRGVPAPLAIAQHGLLPARGTNPSALSNDKIFGAQHLQGRLHPLPLHLACFRTYASTRLLPVAPQGSILGSWRTITQAGLPPARTRGLARPHCPLNPWVTSIRAASIPT